MTRTMVTLALGLTIAGASRPRARLADQAAPRPAENLWDLWAGCWTLTDETTDDGSATIARLLGLPAPQTKGPEPATVCVTTDGARTATLATTLGDRPALTETVDRRRRAAPARRRRLQRLAARRVVHAGAASLCERRDGLRHAVAA